MALRPRRKAKPDAEPRLEPEARPDGAAPPRARGWTILAGVWALLLTFGFGGAATLEVLGPPPPLEPALASLPEAKPPTPPAPVVSGPVGVPQGAGGGAGGAGAGATGPGGAGQSGAGQAGVQPVAASAPTPPSPPPNNNPMSTVALLPPDETMLQRIPRGLVPAVGPGDRVARTQYARPFDRSDPRPRVVVVIDGLGVSDALTEEWIGRLAPAFTLAFSPYGRRLPQHAEAARRRGFETLIGLPLEPVNYPLNDPGPMALLTFEPWGVNRDRLHWVLATMRGYVGAIGSIGGLRGERFAGAREAIGPVIDELEARGLFFLDARPGAEPARASARSIDLVLDEPAVRSETEAKLAQLERLARERGSAIGLLQARPLMLEVVASWSVGLGQRGLVLAPISAVMPGARVPRPALEAVTVPGAPGPPAAAAPKPAGESH